MTYDAMHGHAAQTGGLMSQKTKPGPAVLQAGIRVAEAMARRNLAIYEVWTHGDRVYVRQESDEDACSWFPSDARPEWQTTIFGATTTQGATS
jgi:hypothetical protein